MSAVLRRCDTVDDAGGEGVTAVAPRVTEALNSGDLLPGALRGLGKGLDGVEGCKSSVRRIPMGKADT